MLLLKHIFLCFQFLTRLPLSFVSPRFMTGVSVSSTVWCFPIVGAFIGAVLWGCVWCLNQLGVPFSLQCLAALIAGILLTGALHEDGLADFCDGLGVYDRARALEVMREAQVGSFGALALLVSFAWRGLALYELGSVELLGLCLLLTHMGARALMGGLLIFPLARSDGLASHSGRASWVQVLMALILMVAVFVVFLPPFIALIAILVSMLGVGLIVLIALRRYGGFTGDIYGAGEQVAEMLLLLSFATLLTKIF